MNRIIISLEKPHIKLPSCLYKKELKQFFDYDDALNAGYTERPTLLDLFCGAGGAAMGYYLAGFRIVGMDINPQKHYPFEFYQGDALAYPLEDFDAYHASPPCQGYSRMRHLPWLKGRKYPKLIDATRQRLVSTSRPWVIENVMDAHLPAGWLCGMMFGMPFFRHRAFETSFFWLQLSHEKHNFVIKKGRYFGDSGDRANKRAARNWPWMTKLEQRQAIPPAYTEYIGKYLMQIVRQAYSLSVLSVVGDTIRGEDNGFGLTRPVTRFLHA